MYHFCPNSTASFFRSIAHYCEITVWFTLGLFITPMAQRWLPPGKGTLFYESYNHKKDWFYIKLKSLS